ncbi:hypothetical protein F1188_16540 [Roseospira marina]|uniref:Methyltransferase FkbM domain-containing protein n=1 Tax=Roseospira marina TaxID=140057 RepID=A0A5M6I7T7_9PROT|nr:hypothetical protein [Roseospira marina]KAA5604300.1 hypothetical protein F1188_16540 [Roseospira marina]MBB4315676.1 hypothetical protein [Roseospira marina]MBB5088734.1 hypothetical protein [Roseospira marina]
MDCFELCADQRAVIEKTASRNAVSDHLRIHGEATDDFPSAIPDTDWSRTLILCDIEGEEFRVFTDRCFSTLQRAEIIVEIHKWIDDFWEHYTAFLKRASPYFDIELLERSTLPARTPKFLHNLPDDNRLLMLSEGRPNMMRYLHLKGRA